VIQTHFNYKYILVLKEIALKIVIQVAETCRWP